MLFHLSHWLSPFELAPRILALYAAGAISGAASGFLAWAISYANSPNINMYGWRWLFVIEGLLPIFAGIATFWVLPDFPSTAKWLTQREVEHLALHLHKDAPKEGGKTFDLKESLAIFKDPTYFLFTLIWILQAVGGYGVSLVLPQVIKDMGLAGSAVTNLLQIPPAAAAVIFIWVSAELLRRRIINAFPLVIFSKPLFVAFSGSFSSLSYPYLEMVNFFLILRHIHLIAVDVLVIAGLIILQTVDSPGIRYFAITLLTAAAGTVYPSLWPRRIQALRGTAGAALGIGLHNASAQLSGILGPQLFRVDYGPDYHKPYLAASVMVAAVVVLLFPLWFLLDGNISRYPWLVKRVQAQTHFREGDDQRDIKQEAYKQGDVRRQGGVVVEKAQG
ncbi:hypothetical protein JCM11251_007661 [Rhodosporidiobolus azoricus]